MYKSCGGKLVNWSSFKTWQQRPVCDHGEVKCGSENIGCPAFLTNLIPWFFPEEFRKKRHQHFKLFFQTFFLHVHQQHSSKKSIPSWVKFPKFSLSKKWNKNDFSPEWLHRKPTWIHVHVLKRPSKINDVFFVQPFKQETHTLHYLA